MSKKELRFLYIIKRLVFFSSLGKFNVRPGMVVTTYERTIGRITYQVHFGHYYPRYEDAPCVGASIITATRIRRVV